MAKIEHSGVSGNSAYVQGYDTETKEIYWEFFGDGGWRECYSIKILNQISLPIHRSLYGNGNGYTFALSLASRPMYPKRIKRYVDEQDSFIFFEMPKEKCVEIFSAIARDYIEVNSLGSLTIN